MKPSTKPFTFDRAAETRRRLRLRAALRRRRQSLERDVEIPPAPRCPVCSLLEPHVCVDWRSWPGPLRR